MPKVLSRKKIKITRNKVPGIFQGNTRHLSKIFTAVDEDTFVIPKRCVPLKVGQASNCSDPRSLLKLWTTRYSSKPTDLFVLLEQHVGCEKVWSSIEKHFKVYGFECKVKDLDWKENEWNVHLFNKPAIKRTIKEVKAAPDDMGLIYIICMDIDTLPFTYVPPPPETDPYPLLTEYATAQDITFAKFHNTQNIYEMLSNINYYLKDPRAFFIMMGVMKNDCKTINSRYIKNYSARKSVYTMRAFDEVLTTCGCCCEELTTIESIGELYTKFKMNVLFFQSEEANQEAVFIAQQIGFDESKVITKKGLEEGTVFCVIVEDDLDLISI